MPNPGEPPAKPFQKGNPGGPGRKPGVIQKYRMLDYWGKKLEDDVEKITASERVKTYLRMMELILLYKSLAPNTPPSVLAELEAKFEARRLAARKPHAPVDGSDRTGI